MGATRALQPSAPPPAPRPPAAVVRARDEAVDARVGRRRRNASPGHPSFLSPSPEDREEDARRPGRGGRGGAGVGVSVRGACCVGAQKRPRRRLFIETAIVPWPRSLVCCLTNSVSVLGNRVFKKISGRMLLFLLVVPLFEEKKEKKKRTPS